MRAVVSSPLPHLHFSELEGGRKKGGKRSKLLPFQGMTRSFICLFHILLAGTLSHCHPQLQERLGNGFPSCMVIRQAET